MAKKDNNTQSLFFEVIDKILISFTKKLILKYVASSIPFVNWLAVSLTTQLATRILIPLIKDLIDNGQLIYDKQRGKILYKKLEEAQNETDYDSAHDDIFK